MFKKIALIVVLLLAALLIVAATKPGTFAIQRTTRIQAPPARIFALIDDFHRWPAWSPYEKLDPDMRHTFGGPAQGVGTEYRWEGNGKVGSGRMQIASATPDHITIDLYFTKPMKAHNVAEFSLRPDGDTTDVTWAMHGPVPFVGKIMSVFFSMDKMIGKEFATGLSNLKAVAEAPAPASAAAPISDKP